MTKVKVVKETNWKNYLIKAEQFLETSRDANKKENWNAVGLNTVHAAISTNDALTVYYGKCRAAGEKHIDSVDLLLEILRNKDGVEINSKHLLWLISRKNLVEYEVRLFFKKEAEDALKHADRFFR
jgi:hypothetical protein